MVYFHLAASLKASRLTGMTFGVNSSFGLTGGDKCVTVPALQQTPDRAWVAESARTGTAAAVLDASHFMENVAK
jgi:hypothetical protein